MAEQDEELRRELERLRAENEALKNQGRRGLRLKVSEKGGVSLYGIRRFPVTFYKEEWERILGMEQEIRAFIQFVIISVVVLPFPAFSDGRAYSIARQLRDFGYRGEIRATGNVLPDQLQLMLQVGFDAFDIGERFPLEARQSASKQMSLAYQRGLFRRNSEAEIWTERHTDAEPWLEQPHAG